MVSSKVLLAGLIICLASVSIDWLVPGFLFRKYRELTPETWRKLNKKDYAAFILASVYFGVAMTWFYSNVVLLFPSFTHRHLEASYAVGIGIVCWTVFTLPVIISTSASTNWHPMIGFGICLNSALKVLVAALVASMLL